MKSNPSGKTLIFLPTTRITNYAVQIGNAKPYALILRTKLENGSQKQNLRYVVEFPCKRNYFDVFWLIFLPLTGAHMLFLNVIIFVTNNKAKLRPLIAILIAFSCDGLK